MGAVARPGLNEDEYDVSGAILGEPLRLVKGRTVDIEYPAEAEVVLEGYIPTNEHEPEGPFGEFTGFSTSRSTQNLFYCTGFAHRKIPFMKQPFPVVPKITCTSRIWFAKPRLLPAFRKRCPGSRILHTLSPAVICRLTFK